MIISVNMSYFTKYVHILDKLQILVRMRIKSLCEHRASEMYELNIWKIIAVCGSRYSRYKNIYYKIMHLQKLVVAFYGLFLLENVVTFQKYLVNTYGFNHVYTRT